MDWQALINIVIGVVTGALGWFGRQLWEASAKLREDLHRIETDLPSHYVKKDELRDMLRDIKDDHKEDMQEIKAMLNKIFLKLDEKADKR